MNVQWLDRIWVEKLNYQPLKPYPNKGLTAILKLQMQFTIAFKSFSKSFKIWKSELDLANVTGTSYYWCHLITDANDAIMHQLPNESTKLVCSTTIEILRHSKTPCSMISLFDTGACKM